MRLALLSRTRLSLIVVGLALASACAGCHSHPTGITVTGNCGLGAHSLAVSRLFPDDLLQRIVAPGDYHAVGGLIVKHGRLPAAYDGDCSLRDSSGNDAIRLYLVHRGDPTYAVARKALAAGDLDGFTKVDARTYVIPDNDAGAKGVSVLSDRLVIVELLTPADGVDSHRAMVAAMPGIAARVRALG